MTHPFRLVINGNATPNKYQSVALYWLNKVRAQWKPRSGKGYTGMVDWSGRIPVINSPDPGSGRALYVFLHEVGHVMYEHRTGRQDIRQSTAEYDAEMFAHKVLRANSIPINKTQERWSHEYIGRWAATELSCGEPPPPRHIAQYGAPFIDRLKHLPIRKIWSGTSGMPAGHLKVLEEFCAA